jgi:hypothetical protein
MRLCGLQWLSCSIRGCDLALQVVSDTAAVMSRYADCAYGRVAAALTARREREPPHTPPPAAARPSSTLDLPDHPPLDPEHQLAFRTPFSAVGFLFLNRSET